MKNNDANKEVSDLAMPIQLAPPEEISDKNELFAWCVLRLRNQIESDDRYSWKLKPLWDIEVLTSKQALDILWFKQPNEFRYYKERFLLETGEEFKTIVHDKKWSAYLKADVMNLKSWIEMRRMRLIPKKKIQSK